MRTLFGLCRYKLGKILALLDVLCFYHSIYFWKKSDNKKTWRKLRVWV